MSVAGSRFYPVWRDNLAFGKVVLIRRFPFVVFFQDRENEVRVFAVAHGKRREAA